MRRLKSFSYLSWVFFLACVALLPLISSAVLFSLNRSALTSRYSIIPKLPFIVAVAALALLFWGLEQVKQRQISLRHPLLSLLIMLFLFWVGVSCVFSINPIASFFGTMIDAHGVLLYAACGILAFLALQHIISTKRLITLARALIASGALVALISLIQSISIQWGGSMLPADGLWRFLQGGSVLGNPDFTAAFLVPLCVLAAGLALLEPHIRLRIAYGVALGLMGATVVLSQSRAAYLSLFCAAVFFLIFMLAIRRQGRAQVREKFKLKIVLIALICALGLGLVITGTQLPGLQRKVLPAVGQTADTYSSSRLTFWQQAFKVIASRPLTGTGPDLYQMGTYRFISTANDPQTGERVYVDDPHSYPLLLAATLGVPAVVILLALGVISIYTFRRVLRQKPFGTNQFMYLIFCTAFLAVAVACCFGNANIVVSAIAAVIGATTLAAAKQKAVQKKGILLPALFTTLTLALLVIGVSYALRPLIADYYLQRYQVTNSEQALQRAIDRMPWDFSLREEMIALRSNVLFNTVDANTYKAQFNSLDGWLTDLSKRYPFELGYLLARDDVFLDALNRQGDAGYLPVFRSVLNEQIAQFPRLIDLKIARSQLLFYEGNKQAASSLLDAQPPSLQRDSLRIGFLIAEGQLAEARTALTALEHDWPASSVRDEFIANAQQRLNSK